METVKCRETFLDPDPRSASFAKMNLQTGETAPMTLDDQYEMAEHFRVHDGVPEDVRSYMATITTLWLYGWLYYPFCTLTQFLSTTAIEMALQLRFPATAGRGLRRLLMQARGEGLLRDESFPTLPHIRESQAQLAHEISEISGTPVNKLPQRPYVETLIETLPKIRNSFAHPEMHSIMVPGQAVGGLILAAEIINQLWPSPAVQQPASGDET